MNLYILLEQNEKNSSFEEKVYFVLVFMGSCIIVRCQFLFNTCCFWGMYLILFESYRHADIKNILYNFTILFFIVFENSWVGGGVLT